MPSFTTAEQELLPLDPSPPTKLGRHGLPTSGASLGAAIEIRGKPVRDAVAVITKGIFRERLGEVFSDTFSTGRSLAPNSDSLATRTAWNLVSISLLASVSLQSFRRFGFQEAERWFRGYLPPSSAWLFAQVPNESLWEAEQLLKTVRFDPEFLALLPYILEEHGPGSRASVIKDPSTASARAAKRQAGVFYTPADLADYMVRHTTKLYRRDFLTAKTIDPACGTGVFLLAMLRNIDRSTREGQNFSRFDYITSCLHGLDISGHALDAAAFVLTLECLSEILARNLSPLEAWKSIRHNLVEADALCVEVAEQNRARSSADLFQISSQQLGQLFPQAGDGFDILIGNPPYAALGTRDDFPSLTMRFASLHGAKPTPRLNLFHLFVEMMWRFTKPGCNSAALVTPLSLAYHSGSQFECCRHAMTWNGGRWQFAFFDREPHALFGEEVKTRNAIIFRCEHSETVKRGIAANIETGPLRKWTSRTRDRLFKTINFTAVDSIDITAGIPKLDGPAQAEAFMLLRQRFARFPSLALRVGTCEPFEAFSNEPEPRVFVGGTAYNFLNVYRPTSLLPEEKKMSLTESPLHCVEFKSEVEARAGLAILSSRLCFWLWHVLGDGFHVAGWLFNQIPFSRNCFTDDDFASLSSLGEALWLKLQHQRFTSVNSGRLTVGFRSLSCNQDRDEIDTLLVKTAGLNSGFVAELRSFVQKNAIVDLTDERRDHVSKHFKESI